MFSICIILYKETSYKNHSYYSSAWLFSESSDYKEESSCIYSNSKCIELETYNKSYFLIRNGDKNLSTTENLSKLARDKRATWQYASPLYLPNFPSISYSCSLRLSHSVSPNRCEDLVSGGWSGRMSYLHVLANLMEATDSDICFQGRAYRTPSSSQ